MAKVIFASGVFVIIGIYSLSLKTADEASFRVAKGQALHNQAVQIALAGIGFARVDLGDDGTPGGLPSSQTVSLLDGTVTYKIQRPAGYPGDRLQVISTGTFPVSDPLPHQIVYVSVLKWQDPRWIVERTYKQASAAEYKSLN